MFTITTMKVVLEAYLTQIINIVSKFDEFTNSKGILRHACKYCNDLLLQRRQK